MARGFFFFLQGLAWRSLALVTWGLFWLSPAQAAWRQVQQASLELPRGFLLQRLSPADARGGALAVDTSGIFWRVDWKGGTPQRALTLNMQGPGFSAHQIFPAAAPGQWIMAGQEGEVYRAEQNVLGIKVKPVSLPGHAQALWLAPVSWGKPGAFYLLATEKNRYALYRLDMRSDPPRVLGGGAVALGSEPVGFLAASDAEGEETALVVLEEPGKGVVVTRFGQNEAGVLPQGRATLLPGQLGFLDLLACGGGGVAVVYSLPQDVRPYRVRLVQKNLKPLPGHGDLALQRHHHLWRCAISPTGEARLEAVDETGVARVFVQTPSVVTFQDKRLGGLPPLRRIGQGWYLPLRPLAAQTGLRVAPAAGGQVQVSQKNRIVKTGLKASTVVVNGKPVVLPRPLLVSQEGGVGWVDVQQLWPLLRIPSRFVGDGPSLHVRPRPVVTP